MMLAPTLLCVLLSQTPAPVTLQDPNGTTRAKVVTTSGGALQVSCVGGTCSGGGGGGGSVGDGGYTVVIQGPRLDAGAAWEVFAGSLPLPAGAATAANQTGVGSQTTKLNDGTDTANVTAAGALQVDNSAVTQPISAASLPLPTGASTSANQTALGSQTTKLNDGTDTANITAAGALLVDASATTQPVSGTVTANQGGAPWSLNQTQWNGVAVSVGAGASGTGTVRVMLASDSALAANQSSNIAQMNGVTVSMGTGASGTGTQRVVLSSDSALAANQSVNTAQVNGVTVNVGTGAAGTGTQRVAVASDSSITANAGTNLNTSSLALSATQTDRTQKAQVTDGTRDGTVKAASTAAIATDTSLVVAVSPNSPLPTGANVIGHVIADTGSTTAVTGNVTAVQATGTNLHVVTDATSVLAANQSVNVSQVNGVTTSTGIGASGTGTQRTASLVHDGTTAAGVIAATTALKTDTSSIAGTATSTGVGASGTGVQRIAALIHDGTDTLLISAGGAALVDGTATTQPVSISGGNFPDNEPFNVAQINGVTPLMGVGASGTGALRTASLIHDGTTVAGVIAGTTALKTDTSSVAGTATSTGVGASGAGVQRVASLVHDGTDTLLVTTAGSAQTDLFSISGTAVGTAAAGVQKVGIVGNANAVIDAANTGTAPANVWVEGWQLQSGATATAGTSGQVGSPVASLDHVPYARLGGPVTWTCSLDNIGATLTQCQGVAGAGLKYYLTDVVIASTTATAGQFIIRTGTGSNCATGTASLFPSSATVVRFPYPGNTSTIGSTTIHLITPIAAPAAAAICILCIATQTCTVQMSGYTAP